MAKNLKINIKNTQLAEALNLGDLKSKLAKKLAAKKETPPPPPPPTAIEETKVAAHGDEEVKEEPRRIKARAKSAPPPKIEEEAIPQVESADESPAPLKEPLSPAASSRTPEEKTLPSSKFVPPHHRGVRLGPTGRHVKDLLPPVREKEAPPPPAKKPAKSEEPEKKGEKEKVSFAGQAEKGETEDSQDPHRKAGKPKEFRDVKPLRRQQEGLRSFDARDRQGLRETEEGPWRKRRISKANRPKLQEDITVRPTSLKIRIPISVKDLASEMKLKASQLIAKLIMQGAAVTLNDLLDDETTIQLLGHEFGCEITIDTTEEERLRITDKTIQEEIAGEDPSLLQPRAPVVAFMGHVDHGKTSLIDAIRKSNRVAGEAGAITQHIGAFRCHTKVGDITILDTPGHEAFSAMRTRGAEVTDIVVLVIAGDEGMRQQTVEALEQAKAAKVTIVVAINKSDKPNFNAENVYRQLADHELLPETWGGSTITVNCSAMTGAGVPELLEMLALQAEVLELKANPQARARGTVLESEMHKGMGSVATVLVQNGSLNLGDSLVFGQHFGRIKTMHNEHGKELKTAGPSTPVEITGLSGLPEAGNEFIVVKSEREAREIAEARLEGQRQLFLQQKKRINLESFVAKEAAPQKKKILNVVLRADVQGSLEALKASMDKIVSEKIEINLISAGIGEISESDVQLAAASQAIIVGFHTQIESHAESLIKQTGVQVHLYDVIYHAIDDIKRIMTQLLDKIEQEKDVGVAEVKATFRASQLGVIAGCIVTEGVITRNNRVRVVREGEVIWKGSINSLKRVKDDVREVKKGLECGILLNNYNEVKEGDILQAYEVIYLSQEL